MRAEIISCCLAQLFDRVGEANPKLLHWLCPFLAHDLDRVMRFFSENCSLEMPRGPDPWGSRFAAIAAVREALRSRCIGIPNAHGSGIPILLLATSACRNGRFGAAERGE
jgi:hypothetical protein